MRDVLLNYVAFYYRATHAMQEVLQDIVGLQCLTVTVIFARFLYHFYRNLANTIFDYYLIILP